MWWYRLSLAHHARPTYALDPARRFEPVECRDFGVHAVDVADCGYLIVPENRGDPDSPNIHLAVIMLRSTAHLDAAYFSSIQGWRMG